MTTLAITCPSCQHVWDIEAPAIPWRALPASVRVRCPTCQTIIRVMVQAKEGQVHISFREDLRKSTTCDCGNPVDCGASMCLECKELLGKRGFAIGQKVRIIRRETWQGDICTITKRSKRNPNMYWLKEHGWRRSDEIEPVPTESPL